MNANERKRAERERRKQSGLVRIEEWCHPDDVADVRRYVKRKRDRRPKPMTKDCDGVTALT